MNIHPSILTWITVNMIVYSLLKKKKQNKKHSYVKDNKQQVMNAFFMSKLTSLQKHLCGYV